MNEQERLAQGLKQANIDFSEYQLQQLLAYMKMVLEENKKMNLTAITDPVDFIPKHLLDSILMWGGEGTPKKVLDLGTGGGFPGVPLKIMHPHWDITLLDSTRKKIEFLQRAIEQMKWKEIFPIHGRAEELGKDPMFRECYDLVFSRAVAPLNTLLEYATPFVKVGGYFIAAKGPKCQQELKEAENALRKLHISVEEVREIRLPGDEVVRFLVVMKKMKSTPKTYPRKPGLPGKKPL